MFNCVLIFTLLTFIHSQHNNTQFPEVYGVRWFLGEHFQFTTNYTNDNNEFFVLIFNSDIQIMGDLAVKIAKTKFSCSSKFISTVANQDHHTEIIKNGSQKGDVDQTFLHKCVVSNIQALQTVGNTKAVKYQILLGNIKITQNLDIKSWGYKELVLFSDVFRLPHIRHTTDILWIGDWGQLTQVGVSKGYLDVKPCLSKQILNNDKLSLAFFLGDLAYDLQGTLYYSMLKHIQFITSKMVFMVTPGNHDTLYHSDTFKLFTQSFYSSQWKQYSNYFYTLKLGKLAFISYNPQYQNFDYKAPDRLQLNITQVFQKEFSTQILNTLNLNYFTIVFSHYPIFCSKIQDSLLTCDKNPDRLAAFRQYFDKMNMKLYFSGHLHVYERTRPICSDGTIYNQSDQSQSDTYNFSCPIYVVEGAGGNDFFVETKKQYSLKNFSKKIVYNSGYGILSISSDSVMGYPKNVTYKHVSAQSCNIKDRFMMLVPKTTPNTAQTDEAINLMKVMLKVSLVSFSFSGIIMLALFISKKYKQKKQATNQVQIKSQKDVHIQMVEEQIQEPQKNNVERNQ